MIKKLYVIQNTGQCLYHLDLRYFDISKEKSDQETAKDPNLISGFFAAILAFANAVEGESGVNKLALKNSNYYFIRKDTLHYIIETDLSDIKFTEDDFYTLLNDISLLIEVYMVENDIDQAIMQIDNDDEDLVNTIKNKISKFIRKKLFQKVAS